MRRRKLFTLAAGASAVLCAAACILWVRSFRQPFGFAVGRGDTYFALSVTRAGFDWRFVSSNWEDRWIVPGWSVVLILLVAPAWRWLRPNRRTIAAREKAASGIRWKHVALAAGVAITATATVALPLEAGRQFRHSDEWYSGRRGWRPWISFTWPYLAGASASAALSMGFLVLLRRAMRADEARARAELAGRVCPSCGYDLRATPERCPECGAIPAAKGKLG